MKYVIGLLVDGKARTHFVSMFDDVTHHNLTWRAMQRSALIGAHGEASLVGAGFTDPTTGTATGWSETLNHGPGPDDVAILRRFLGLGEQAR